MFRIKISIKLKSMIMLFFFPNFLTSLRSSIEIFNSFNLKFYRHLQIHALTTSIKKINDMRILTPRLNLISKYCKRKNNENRNYTSYLLNMSYRYIPRKRNLIPMQRKLGRKQEPRRDQKKVWKWWWSSIEFQNYISPLVFQESSHRIWN